MVLKKDVYKSFRALLSITIFYIVIVGALYLIINIFHLVWYIIGPEGIWDFTYFLGILRVTVFSIPVFIALLLAPILLYNYIRNIFKKGLNGYALIKGLGILFFFVILVAIKGSYNTELPIWFTKKMSNKNSYISKSRKLINSGKFNDAYIFSKNAYEKQKYLKQPSAFFLLSKLYSRSTIDKNIRLNDLYGSIISYAYCNEIIEGSNNKTEALYREAINLIESNDFFQNKQRYLLQPLSALAYIAQDRGNYKEADALFYRLENISLGLSSDDARSKINDLTAFLSSRTRAGDLVKVRDILSDILNVYHDNDLKKGQEYKNYLFLKISVDLKLDSFNAALKSFKQLMELEISKKDKIVYPSFLLVKSQLFESAYHKEISRAELNLPKSWYSSLNIFSREITLIEESESLLIERIEEIANNQGQNSLFFISSIRELGQFYRRNGYFDEAAFLYRKLLNNTALSNEDLYTEVLIDYISISEKLDDSIIEEAEKLLFRKINEKLLFLNENDKESFISKIENQVNVLNNYYLENSSDANNEKLFNNVLRFKEVALNSNLNIRRFVSKLPIDIQDKYWSLHQSSKSVDRVDYLEEREMLEVIRSQEDFEKNFTIYDDYELIKNCLNESEYAIEIINAPFLDASNKMSIKYYALIINSQYEYPKKVELFQQNQLESIINSSKDLKTHKNGIYSFNNTELRDLIWTPLDAFIDSDSNIFISLSGDLNKVAISSLFINSPTNIHILSSTRNIIDMTQGLFVPGSQNVAMGDVNFNTIDNKLNERSLSSINNNIAINLKNGVYNSLSHTKDEVLNIDSIFINKNESTQVFLNKEASESNFRKLDGGEYNFIHMATHGFYFAKQEVALTNYESIYSSADDSMNRSGILLSQDPHNEYSHENDGIITAREISAMDFSKVDLVVLSACDTGLGDYKGSEGIFGLRRAFKIAGVKKQIVSLWKVPDKETSELFFYFYQSYSEGMSAYDSLKEAKLIMSEQYDAFYWAGFELIE